MTPRTLGALSLGAVSRKVQQSKLLREPIVEARRSVRALTRPAHSTLSHLTKGVT